MESDSELSLLEQAFVAEFIISENATASYCKAFKQVRGRSCTYLTARTEGSRLLTSPHIQAEFKAARNDLRKRGRVRADKVVRELGKIAFSDIDNILDLEDSNNPRLKPRKEIPAAARHAIKELSCNKRGVKIKMFDKLAALDKLARIQGLYQELPPLEQILALLPTKLRDEVRGAIAAGVLADTTQLGNGLERGEAGESTPLGTLGPEGYLQGRGDDGRSLATGVFTAPSQETIDALLPTGGDEHGVGGEDVDALFK